MSEKTRRRLYEWGGLAVTFCAWTPMLWVSSVIRERHGHFDAFSRWWSWFEVALFLASVVVGLLCMAFLVFLSEDMSELARIREQQRRERDGWAGH